MGIVKYKHIGEGSTVKIEGWLDTEHRKELFQVILDI